MLLSLLILAILARVLPPGDFGLLGIALIFVGFTEIFGNLGVGPAIVQRLDLTDLHVDIAFTLSVILGAVMTVAIWLFAPIGALLFDEPIVSQMLKALSIVFVIAGFGVVPEHMLRRKLQFKNLIVADLLSQSLGYGLVAIIMAFLGFGVWSLVIGTVIRYTLRTAILIRFRPPHLRFRWASPEAIDLLGYGTGFSLTSVSNFIAQQGGPFVIGRSLGIAALGYYTRAYSLISLPLRLGSRLIHVLFPAMSERQEQRERLGDVYICGIEILSLVAFPASALLFLSAPEIVAVVLGGQWGTVVPVLQILAMTIMIRTCEAMNPPVVRALGAVYGEAWRQAIFALLSVTGAWFGSQWGLRGIATAIVIAWMVVHLLMTQLSLSLLGLPWRRLTRCHLPAVWTGFWVALALLVATQQLRAASVPIVASLIIELLVGIAAAIAAVYFAPPFAQPLSIDWVLRNVHFDAMGKLGNYLYRILILLYHRSPESTNSKQ